MTATDKKRRKLAQTIGESFTALRRRTVRSGAWLSLSAPATKILMELKIRFRRHKDGSNNNGYLYLSHHECMDLLKIPKGTAQRAFAELEAKGFLVKTRQGEAGALPNSGTLDNDATGYARRATLWALTDEPYKGQPPTHAYEKWTETPKRRHRPPGSGRRGKTGSWFHPRNHRVPPMEPSAADGSTHGTVEAGIGDPDGSTHGTSVSTIYIRSPERAANAPPKRPWRTPTYVEMTRAEYENGQITAAAAPKTAAASKKPKSRRKRKGWNTGTAWPTAERLALGLKQQELARLAGITRSYLSAVEQGLRNPGPDIRARLEAALQAKRTAA